MNRRGFTFVELLTILLVVGFIAAYFLLPRSGSRARAPRINCVNNLKQIGLSFRTWSIDHNDQNPMAVFGTNGGSRDSIESGVAFLHFQTLSNELSTPKILACPSDKRVIKATNFTSDFDNRKLSYFVGVDANQTNSQMLLAGDRNITNGCSVKSGFLNLSSNEPAGWTEKIHELQGNVGLADGSVQQLSKLRLRDAIASSGAETNRLVMP